MRSVLLSEYSLDALASTLEVQPGRKGGGVGDVIRRRDNEVAQLPHLFGMVHAWNCHYLNHKCKRVGK